MKLAGEADDSDVNLDVNAFNNTITGGEDGIFLGIGDSAYMSVSLRGNSITGVSDFGLYAIDRYSSENPDDGGWGTIRIYGTRSSGNRIRGGWYDVEGNFWDRGDSGFWD